MPRRLGGDRWEPPGSREARASGQSPEPRESRTSLKVMTLLSPPQKVKLHPFSTPLGLEKREKMFILFVGKIPLPHRGKRLIEGHKPW